MAKEIVNTKIQPHTIVIYGDGSAIQQGPIGSGIHGYIYLNDALGKKNNDRPKNNIISNIGYIETELLPKYEGTYETVIPEAYLDGFFSYNYLSTNNVAELNAFIDSAYKVIEMKMENSEDNYNIVRFLFNTDSMYLINVVNNISKDDRWKTEDKINKDCWIKISEILQAFIDLEITYKIYKVIGHSGNLGNHISDRMALLGRLQSTRLEAEKSFIITPSKNYWTKTPERHPFLSLRQLFFTNVQREESKENMFGVMKYKKDDELGKKSHEACFGLVIFNQPDEYIESIIAEYQRHVKTMSILSSVDLNNIYSNNVSRTINLFGTKPMMFNKQQGALKVLEEYDIVNEIRPAGLATQAFNKVVNLYTLISYYRNGGTEVIKSFDITDKFYGLDGKGKIKTMILNGVNTVDIEFTYEDNVIKLPLELGKDLIDRNAIKKLESPDVKITLLVEKISPLYLQYYIIIDVQDKKDISIWHNFYSNSVLIKALKKTK